MDKTLLLSVANYVITTTLTSGLLRFWAADSGPTDESGAPTLLVRSSLVFSTKFSIPPPSLNQQVLHCTAFASLLALSDPLVQITDFRKTIGWVAHFCFASN